MKNLSNFLNTCSHCFCSFNIGTLEALPPLSFCPFCGYSLKLPQETANSPVSSAAALGNSSLSSQPSVTLIKGHELKKEAIQFSLGTYQILHEIGKGGMGEVFLAYDRTCGRKIALKRIRSDLVEHIQMHNRFLKEAHITSQLTHPSIIPIYAIHTQNQAVYYTMPFVEGKTLKEIVRCTALQEKKGEILDHIGGSIPALMRIFLSVCQAIAYAHSKGVLHRDIKPENIIIGQFGEVLILDWGLAKLMASEELDELDSVEQNLKEEVNPILHQLTHIGRVVGTINYMAPERAIGNPATFQTDIYSLGVILYQLLTLRNPFNRGTLKQFRENMHLEVLADPLKVSPYREIPRVLSCIVLKCLSANLDQRYLKIHELIRDIENYIEGRAEWFHLATLDIDDKSSWEFQENVLIAEHVAITRGADIADWVSLMISKSSFSSNVKLEARIKLSAKSQGIGFLWCIPEAAERTNLNDGYCLWLGNDKNHSTKLLRSTVEVFYPTDVHLLPEKWYHVKIEKLDNTIYFHLNNELQFSYISHIPLLGTHVGILSRDADFILSDFNIFVGSQSVMVNCLAVPNAFLAHKDYTTALNEYRRIGYSFPGRAEGREAMFRAGVTLMEQAQNCQDTAQVAHLFDLALDEFEKLHHTPGAPLEYLGKSLVYQSLNEVEEEIKCLELAFRRYPAHPLLTILREQILYRMHASSRLDRKATYMFMLLAIRHLPQVVSKSHTQKLFTSLKKHGEPLFFLQEELLIEDIELLKTLDMGILLAFWLHKHYILEEIICDLAKLKTSSAILICNALFCLIELGNWQQARALWNKVMEVKADLYLNHGTLFQLIDILLLSHEKSWILAVKKLLKLSFITASWERAVIYLLKQSVIAEQPALAHQLYRLLIKRGAKFTLEGSILIDSLRIWAYLLENRWSKAGDLLYSYPLETLNHETTPLHFLYGCWLYAVESKELAIVHFAGILETPFPRSWTLFAHFYGQPKEVEEMWLAKAFDWEKREYYRQALLFYKLAGETELVATFQKERDKMKLS